MSTAITASIHPDPDAIHAERTSSGTATTTWLRLGDYPGVANIFLTPEVIAAMRVALAKADALFEPSALPLPERIEVCEHGRPIGIACPYEPCRTSAIGTGPAQPADPPRYIAPCTFCGGAGWEAAE